MLGRIVRLAAVAGAGYAAWKVYSKKRAGDGFFAQALGDGAAEVEAARSAQLRGASVELRKLAQHMEHAHISINKRLSEAAGTEVPLVDEAQRQALHEVEAQQGEAFDQAWLAHEAQSHERAIRLFRREARHGGPGADVAAELLPELQAHADEIAALRAGEPAQSSGNGHAAEAGAEEAQRPEGPPGVQGANA